MTPDAARHRGPGARIRPFVPADLDAVVAANDAIGWRDRRGMIAFHAGREDSALLVADRDGVVVGCGGATVFPGSPPTGWVHGIVVRPDVQRGGLGRALTEAAIAWLRARSVATVLLLATDAGRPVYERLGFEAGERYGAFDWMKDDDAGGATVRAMTASDLPAVRALDREATGEDRSAMIDTLASSGWVATRGDEVQGFHVACPWGGGPTIARDPAIGLGLLRFSTRLQPAAWMRPLGVPESNAEAVRCLAARGAIARRHVTRMWLGAAPAWQPAMIFGVFNFAVA